MKNEKQKIEDNQLIERRFILLNSIPLGVCIINESLEVIFWNKTLANWTNINRNEILNQQINLFFPHLKQPKYYTRFQQIFNGAPPAIFSSQLHKNFIPSKLPNDKFRIEHTIVISIPSLLDNTYYAMIVIQDVTELTDRMQQQSKMKDDALREIEYRRKIESQLSEKTEELEKRNIELTQLYNISKLLQNCHNFQEVYQIISEAAQLLFPDLIGGIFMVNEEGKLEKIIDWKNLEEEDNDDNAIFQQCFLLWQNDQELIKKFNLPESQCFYLPLKVKDENLGIMYLGTSNPEGIEQSTRIFAINFAEQISLVLSNITLQDKLYQMVIRDGLTGLYNRRYLEDFLSNELNRANRNNFQIGIIMIDIDHFKQFNDSFGHQAGDLVLIEIANLLKRKVRQYDIPCRYGGEELTIVLPSISLHDVRKKAEEIRIAIKKLQLEYKEQKLPQVTVSCGVSCFPENGLTSQSILRAADVALYQAKTKGRNRVMVANSN